MECPTNTRRPARKTPPRRATTPWNGSGRVVSGGANAGANDYNKPTVDWSTRTFHRDGQIFINAEDLFNVTFYIQEPGEEEFTIQENYSKLVASGTAESALTKPDTSDQTVNGVEYTFDGWYLDRDCTEEAKFDSTITERTDYYGKYVPKYYTVTYDKGDHGTLAGQNENGQVVQGNLKSGDPTPAAPEVTADDGWYFTGWDKEIADTVTKSVTYTATYSEKQVITVTANSDTQKYNGAEQSVSGYTVSPALPMGYTVEGLTAGGASGKDVGTYDNTISGTVVITDDYGRDVTDNYDIRIVNGKLTITPAQVTVTADDQSKVVGEDLPELTYTFDTEVASETPAFTGELAYKGDDTRGDHKDQITQGTLELADGEGFKASNYTLDFVPGTLTIHARGMQVKKTVDKTQAKVGDTLLYTITVTNTGDVELTNITVTDPMLNVETVIETLALGAVWREEFTYEVQSADAGKTIVNTVVAKAADGTEDEATSGGTEITRPSTGGGGGGGSTVLNTEDHYSYIIGYQDGNVRPYGTVTRGEVATIFFRLLTDEARDKYWSQDSGYSDCGPDLWCNNAISTLSNMGIISGYEDGTFRPYAKITRAQFAKIAVGFFETTTQEYAGYYTDVPDNAWYTDYVEAASRVGLIQGFQDGTFRPNENITRAQACVIVNRALGRTPAEERLLPEDEMIIWPDCTPDDWFYADIQEATNSHDYTIVTVKGEKVEKWSGKLPQRDWAAFEHAWSTAHSAPGGEVVK